MRYSLTSHEPPEIDTEEKALLLAVLDRAVRDLLPSPAVMNVEDRKEVRRSARRFFRAFLASSPQPYTFIYIADHLDFNPLDFYLHLKELYLL